MKQCGTISKSYARNSMSQFLSTLEGRICGGWIFAPTWKLSFTLPLIRIDYTSSPQSLEAALRVPEPILTDKMLKKI